MLARLALGNVRKSLADFGIYFLTVMLGVAVFYAFNSMTAQQGVLAFSETQSKMFDLLGMVIGGVSVFIAFVLVFLVVYANSFLIKRRKREFVVADFAGQRAGEVLFKPRTVLPFSTISGPGGLSVTARSGVPAAQTGRQVPIVRPFSLRRMRTMAQIGDQKGFCASFGRGGEPFPTLLASVTAPFSFWYEGEEQDGFLRVLTPLECERLMGLPENWTKYGCKDEEISDHARYRALGNSIALPCAEYVMAGIAEVMN